MKKATVNGKESSLNTCVTLLRCRRATEVIGSSARVQKTCGTLIAGLINSDLVLYLLPLKKVSVTFDFVRLF